MLNQNIPAGNHVIKAVQYDSASNTTKLSLCCGQTAWLSMLLTTQYKPEAGDYWIVTDHGTQSLFKKVVFEGATKPMDPSKSALDKALDAGVESLRKQIDEEVLALLRQPMTIKRPARYMSDMFGTYPVDPFMVGVKLDTQFPFERQTAKPETMGMREENGWVEKTINDKPKDMTCADICNEALRILGPMLNPNPTPEDFGVPPGYGKAADNYARYINEKQNAKLVNIIKSLTAQNEKKQKAISDYRNTLAKSDALHRKLRERNDTQSQMIYQMRKHAEEQINLANGN